MVGAWSTWIGEIVSAGEKRDESVSTLVRLCELEKYKMRVFNKSTLILGAPKTLEV